jgi:plasmid stability protein
MKNVTITLDEETARWARIYAAEHDTSVSRMLGEMLQEKMRMEEHYRAAMRYYLSEPPRKLKRPGKKYPKREELYAR